MYQNIVDYLPVYENDIHMVQARVGRSLYKRVNVIRKQRKLTWNELVTGLFKKLVDDVPLAAAKKADEDKQVDFLAQTG